MHEIADRTCPNIFTLTPVQLDGLNVDLMYQQYKMQLCCQAPGAMHAAGEPYLIKVPRDWLQADGPYYNKLVKMLKLTVPVLIPGIKEVLDKATFDALEPIAEEIKESAISLNELQYNEPITAHEHMPVHNIRKLLEKIDPQQHWGGLRSTVTPEGYVLWLCQEHYEIYKK